MSDTKYEMRTLTTGKFEEIDTTPQKYIDQVAKTVAGQSHELYQMYKAERDIVRSILKRATEDDESTD